MTENRKITFSNMTGRFDVPSFTLAENSDLRITIDFSGLKSTYGMFRLFVVHGNAAKYTFAFTKNSPTITLPAEWIQAGGLEYIEFSMKQYNDTGTTLINGGYIIEPLAVTAEEGTFVVTSMIQELIDSVAALREELSNAFNNYTSATNTKINEFTSATNETVSDLMNAANATIYAQKEELNSRFEAYVNEMENFKGNISTTLEETTQRNSDDYENFKSNVESRLAETNNKLSEAMDVLEAEKAAKEQILQKLNDYIDNGVDLFPEELTE